MLGMPEQMRRPDDDAFVGSILELERDEQGHVPRRARETRRHPRRARRRRRRVWRSLFVCRLGRGGFVVLGLVDVLIVGACGRSVGGRRRQGFGIIVDGLFIESESALADLVKNRVLVSDQETMRLVAVPDERGVRVSEREVREVIREPVALLQADDIWCVVKDSGDDTDYSCQDGEPERPRHGTKSQTYSAINGGIRSFPFKQSLPGNNSRPVAGDSRGMISF